MSVQDVESKRLTYLQKVDDYLQALSDHKEGQIDQQQLDAALNDANQAGKDYADQVGESSLAEGVTNDELFSNPSLMDEDARSGVARVIRTGSVSKYGDLPFLVLSGNALFDFGRSHQLASNDNNTISIIFVRDGDSNDVQNLISFGGHSNGISLAIGSDNKLRSVVRHSGNIPINALTDFVIEKDKPYRVDAQYNGDDGKLVIWVNDQKVADVSSSHYDIGGSYRLFVGGHQDERYPGVSDSASPDRHFYGKVHKAAVWKTVIQKADLDRWWDGVAIATPALLVDAASYGGGTFWNNEGSDGYNGQLRNSSGVETTTITF